MWQCCWWWTHQHALGKAGRREIGFIPRGLEPVRWQVRPDRCDWAAPRSCSADFKHGYSLGAAGQSRPSACPWHLGCPAASRQVARSTGQGLPAGGPCPAARKERQQTGSCPYRQATARADIFVHGYGNEDISSCWEQESIPQPWRSWESLEPEK